MKNVFSLSVLIVLLSGAFMSNASFSANNVPKFGYVPVTFPRDITQVNQFGEHVVLGQILEPLVDADRFGSITRGVAESWHVSTDGKTLTFKISKGQQFSNGKPIGPKDVKFSLDRHLTEKTQSSNFVRAIKEVKVVGTNEIVITLTEPNVSILKALTRDHLGIVPEGWKYDTNSDEPIIGSGPYRLLRKGTKWLLVKNERYHNPTSISIPEWELCFFKNEASDVGSEEIPDFVPMATQDVHDDLLKFAGKKKISMESKEQLSFAQTSLWWHPHGVNYRSNEIKVRAMTLLAQIIENAAKSKHLQRATGIVPVGIAGSLPEPVKLASSKIDKDAKRVKIRVAALGNTFNFLFEGKEVKDLAENFGIDLEMFSFSPNELATLGTKKPDAVIASWAGGFNDPEGFLPLLNLVLGVDFVEYLENLRPLYQSARVEQDWTKRSAIFKEFNQKIVQEMRMIPGWKIPMYSLSRNGLIEEKVGFRYTPRLNNVKRTN